MIEYIYNRNMTNLLNKPFCLTDDYLFKNIFIDPESLRSFLNNILIDGEILPADTKILEIDYLNTPRRIKYLTLFSSLNCLCHIHGSG